MSTERVTPDVQAGPGGVLVGTATQPRWGERAAEIRKLSLRYPELSPSDIARKVGCTPDNVYQVLSRFLGKNTTDELSTFQENKPDLLEALQYRTLASITDSDITNASYLQRITGAAIIEDKIRLMRGQPTSIHVHALVDVLDALRMRESQE